MVKTTVTDPTADLASLEAEIRLQLASEDFAETEELLQRYSETLRELIRDCPEAGSSALAHAGNLFRWMHQMVLISRAGYGARLSALSTASYYLSGSGREASGRTLQVTL